MEFSLCEPLTYHNKSIEIIGVTLLHYNFSDGKLICSFSGSFVFSWVSLPLFGSVLHVLLLIS